MEHVPRLPRQDVDSTGAGDAFIGSFAVFLGEGRDEREAVSRANLYAALSTTAVGTQKSFVDRRRSKRNGKRGAVSGRARSARRGALRSILALLRRSLAGAPPSGARLKVIADQDSAGPQGTNFLSLLMLLNAPRSNCWGSPP